MQTIVKTNGRNITYRRAADAEGHCLYSSHSEQSVDVHESTLPATSLCSKSASCSSAKLSLGTSRETKPPTEPPSATRNIDSIFPNKKGRSLFYIRHHAIQIKCQLCFYNHGLFVQ